MAKITRDQIKKMNDKMGNGWTVDLQTLLMWNEKTATQCTEPDKDGVIFEIDLKYQEERIGEGWTAKRTRKQIVNMSVKKLIPSSTNRPEDEYKMYEVNFLHDENIGEPQNKKMFSYIQKLTHTLDFNEIIAEYITPKTTEEATTEESDELTEALRVAEVLGNDAQVCEGMKFEDESGEVFIITKLDSMQVEFNGGQRSLYDFGTARTVGAVINGLGNGARLMNAPQDAQTANEDTTSTTDEEAPEQAQEEPQTTTETDETTESEETPTETAETATETTTEDEQTTGADTTEEEPTEETEAAQTGAESTTDAPQKDKPDYSALAAAYFTGKTIKATKKPKEETTEEIKPEPEQTTTEDEPQEPPKTAPGFTGKPSDILTEEEAEKLNNGEQIRKKQNYYNRIFTTVKYTDRTALLYNIDLYNGRTETIDPLQPGNNFNYKGFITDGKTYIDPEPIREEMRSDIAEELRRMIPNEKTARTNAENCEDWQRRPIENAEQYGANNAKSLFYQDKTPQLYLYSHNENIKTADIIRYIEDPAQVVTEYAQAYADSHAAEIAADYITYNALTAAIKEIKDNPSDPAHMIKRIAHCIGEKEKTAKVELKSGEVVTVEARAIRHITSGDISNYYVKAFDRDKLPKNEDGRTEDIQPEQIKAIYHGQRVLYRAA